MKRGFVVEIGVLGIGDLRMVRRWTMSSERAMRGVERMNMRRRKIRGIARRKIWIENHEGG